MEILEYVGLLAAAFAAGAINAVAGGGSLISFPALIAFGFVSKTANVTNTVALWPGYVGGSFGYREELRRQRRRLLALLPPCVAGALVGSVVLLSTPESAFDAIVPFMILFACALMAFQDRLASFALAHRVSSQGDHVPLPLLAATFVMAIYGAYFGAGLGIVMLGFLSILLPDDIQHSNALKGMLSLIINAVAVMYFVAFGPVRWTAVLVMGTGAVAGGYLGVGVARGLGRTWLRVAVISYGLVVVVLLLVR
ncbi:MAG: sulfite exporter TauE/SafE family protein [Chloroflexota bacterium]|nr:sulfite exporter TauE/SafE family protein [Chloroflexota bacterium]